MTQSARQIDELRSLLGQLAAGQLSPLEVERLNQLLANNAQAQQMFADYAMLDACLEMVWTSGEGQETRACSPSESEPTGAVLPVLTEGSPLSHAPLSMFYPVGSFVSSYVAAALIVGIALLIGWAYQLSIPRPDRPEAAQAGPRPGPTDIRPKPETVFVGRVTDMTKCEWVDPKTGTLAGAYVPLGRTFALVSGLMEVTYDTGAKVILQGPCTYQVESRTGGFLTQGRLTARLVKKAESGLLASTAKQHSDTRRTLSPFVVRTPTAEVADLGTEFGVEVDKFGVSKAHVYEGKVEFRAIGIGAKSVPAILLMANDSARTELGKDRAVKVVRETGEPSPFERHMPRRVRIKMFSTGVNAKVGDADPHWQLVARSDQRNFKPQPAMVTELGDPSWLPNEPGRSQWISVVRGEPLALNAVNYTFRTSFDLTGMRPATAVLHGQFMADNHVQAIRLNGHEIRVLSHGYEEFSFFHVFSTNRGFVEGVNVLEIEVENATLQNRLPTSPMGLRVELEGSVLSAWAGSSTNVAPAKQKDSEN